MKKGDIVLVPFPFTDLSGSKKRPALVLIASKLDVTVAFITTRLKWRTSTDLLLKKTPGNGLKVDSLVKISKIATLDRELAIGRLGRLSKDTLKEVDRNLIKLLKIDCSGML